MLKEKKNCTFRYRSWKLTRQWSRARHSGVHGWRVHVNHVLLSLVLSTNFSQRFKVHGLVHNRCSIMLPWQALRGGGGRGFLHRKKSPYIELDPISKHYADKAYDVQNKSVVFSSPWAFHHLPPQALKKVGRRKQYKISSRNKHVYPCISLRYASLPYNPTSHIQYENLKVPWYSE